MTAQKRARKEPLLSTVARKLGYVAGTLTHVAQGLTRPSSATGSAAENLRVRKPAAVDGKPIDSVRPKKANSRRVRRPKKANPLGKKAPRSKVSGSRQKRATKSRTQR